MKDLSYFQNAQKDLKTWVDERFRPRYHFTAPAGFINDPNGFTVYNGKYQLFYQCRYEGYVGWGSAESEDLLHFTHRPLAVFPDQPYDKDGCWSGGAIEKDCKLYILYTGQNNATETAPQRECQCLAVSEDGGVTFTKAPQNPVIPPELLTGDASHADFRDPTVWKHGDTYYAIVGNSKNSVWQGQLQLFSSADLISWKYVGVALDRADLGSMWECPSFCTVDEETDLIVMSPIDVPANGHDYHNSRSTVYLIGKMDYATGKFTVRAKGEVDHGKDFYAAQITRGVSGVPVLIAWMANWDRHYKTEHPFVGFANNFTLPRRLEIAGDTLLQFPAQGVDSAFHLKERASALVSRVPKTLPNISGASLRLKVTADMKNAQTFTVNCFEKGETKTVISYDKAAGVLTLDASRSTYPTGGEKRERVFEGIRTAAYAQAEDTLSLDIFLDVNTVEVFTLDGKATMSTMSFNEFDCTGISFAAEGEAAVTVETYEFK